MEKLYNNILLSENFAAQPSDARHVPYLEQPPEIIDVSVGRQLFVDDFLIEHTDLQAAYHKAKKYEGNPVLKAEMPWETAQSPVACPKSGGVWYDEEERLFKMWYEAGWLRHMCYAVSKDGLHWERPELDEVPGTNIILPYTDYEPEKYQDGLGYLRPDSTTVVLDTECLRNEKYKLFMRNPGGHAPGIVAVSSDGIHFRSFKWSGEVDDRSTIFYNPFRKKWVYSIRQHTDNWVRERGYRECDDLLQGAEWAETDVHRWLMCDDLDKPNPYIGAVPQLYNVDCVGYESIMLGMFQIHLGPENAVCEENGIPKITELIPMYSRDGYHFSRPCRDSFIQSSMYKGEWDRGYVQSVGGVTVINGDELWIYYIGFGGDENYHHQSWITNGVYRNGATGLAKLRRDGFVSMHGTGTLTTRKMQFSGKTSFFVNANGWVWVELLDEEGRFLDRTNTFEGNHTKAELCFEKTKVDELNDRVFRLCFHVRGDLYAFGFANAVGDFGGAHAAGIVK